MKSYISIIISFMTLVLLPVLGGCADDPLYEREGSGADTNAILFNSAIAFPTMQTRGADEDGIESYEPLMVKGGGMQLYLHGYSAYRGSYPELGDSPVGNQEGATRGVQIRNMDAFTDNYKTFTVRADYKDDGTPYFDARTASLINRKDKDNAIWRPQGGMYWPGQKMLTFYAWAPAELPNTLTGLVATKEYIHFSYTAPKASESEARDADIQPDLVFAASDCNKQEAVEGRAPLKFHHALSAVKFAVRDVVGGVVKQISLHNIYGKGECSYIGTTTPEGKIVTDGSFQWKVDESYKTDYYQNFDTRVADSGTYPNESQDVMLTDDASSKVFMLIPQELPDDAEIEVVFERDVVPEGETAKTVVMRGRIKDADHAEWLPGREYVYSISTSSANWSYVFKVVGSYRNGTEVFMPCPNDGAVWDSYYMAGGDNHPYFEVTSYRFRSNKPSIKEVLPWDTDWEAKMSDDKEEITQWEYTKSFGSFENKDKIPFANRDKNPAKKGRTTIKAKDWMQSPKGFSGDGSVTASRYNIEFTPTSVTTTWDGDAAMYGKKAYGHADNKNPTSKELPWDLSRFERVDLKKHKRNTANSYVVDREGWYCFPLYYGNSMTDDKDFEKSYHAEGLDKTDGSTKVHSMWNLKDHNGNKITKGKIDVTNDMSAHLLWQDAYNLVDSVELVRDLKGEPMIRFHVVGENIQQGNVLIGLVNSRTLDASNPKVVWSWHIWTNEHWLNDEGLSNAFSNSGFDNTEHPESHMRRQGDVPLVVPRTKTVNQNYTLSGYNVGWCDAKHVLYLARFAPVSFTQYEQGKKKPSGKSASLNFLQEGSRIEYKYGNNVYYQFGRKDPFVGFVDHDNHLKDNFGPVKYTIEAQRKSIKEAIQNPHKLYVGAAASESNNDWNSEGNANTWYHNFWNNETTFDPLKRDELLEDEMYHKVVKTIYDPSPAGYVVPPIGLFKILYRNYRTSYVVNSSNWTKKSFEADLNGKLVDDFHFKIYTQVRANNSDSYPYFSLTATGHRWYAKKDTSNPKSMGPGENFNPNLAYLWSCHMTWLSKNGSAWTIAVGNDFGDDQTKVDNWIISTGFVGRRSMARPVRSMRESTSIRAL